MGPVYTAFVSSSAVMIVTDTLYLCSVLPKIQISCTVVTNTCAEY